MLDLFNKKRHPSWGGVRTTFAGQTPSADHSPIDSVQGKRCLFHALAYYGNTPFFLLPSLAVIAARPYRHYHRQGVRNLPIEHWALCSLPDYSAFLLPKEFHLLSDRPRPPRQGARQRTPAITHLLLHSCPATGHYTHFASDKNFRLAGFRHII